MFGTGRNFGAVQKRDIYVFYLKCCPQRINCTLRPFNLGRRGRGRRYTLDELKGLRILLVEDSWHVGEALKKVLASLGAEVAGPAATVAEAEGLLSECAPDVALVDVYLRDGELADGLIDRLNGQDVSVIVILGREALPAVATKVAGFLRKPFTSLQILATLQPVIAQKD